MTPPTPLQLQVRTVPVEQLVLDPDNVRRHDRRNLDAIAASLREFGQVKPIVTTSEGVVVAGNGTLTAAVELGWSHVAVVEFPSTDPDRVRAYAIADNRSGELAEWDGAALLAQLDSLDDVLQPFTGFDQLDVKALRAIYDDPKPADSGKTREPGTESKIVLTVNAATRARWRVTWDGFAGESDDDKLNELLDALGIPPADYADDDQGV